MTDVMSCSRIQFFFSSSDIQFYGLPQEFNLYPAQASNLLSYAENFDWCDGFRSHVKESKKNKKSYKFCLDNSYIFSFLSLSKILYLKNSTVVLCFLVSLTEKKLRS